MNQTQITHIKGELETINQIAAGVELFPGHYPEIPTEERLWQVRKKCEILLKWIDSGMPISAEEYPGEDIESDIFR